MADENEGKARNERPGSRKAMPVVTLVTPAVPPLPNGDANHTSLACVDTDLDHIVRDLRHLYVAAGLQLSIEMGRLIIDRIFGGDFHRWRSRGRKEVSFRKLERHPELPFRASTLSRSVAIYTLSRRRADLGTLLHVGPSHLYEIVALDEVDQDRLLACAESDRWSVRRLRQEARGVAKQTGRLRGQKATPPKFVAWLRGVRQEGAVPALTAELKAVEALELDEARELLETTRGLLQNLEVLARTLGNHIGHVNRSRRTSDVVPVATSPQDGVL